MDARLYHVEMLFHLWALPILAGFFIYAAHRRHIHTRRFAEAGLLPQLNPASSRARRAWKAVLILAAAALTVLALARPAWNPKPKDVQSSGRDVVFVVDVSRSMLAEDLAPSRLGRAKMAILDCLDKLNGDRVGLVAFAGTAVAECPLTLDYGFLRGAVERMSPNDVPRGGTLLGDAVRMALKEVFDGQQKAYKDLVLITDGEDHESLPVEAAQKAAEEGVRIIAIGLGDENQGKRIPITDESGQQKFLTYNGQEVWSKLDADTLRKMAEATPGGKYLNVATGAFDLGAIYESLIASAEKTQFEAKTMTVYEEKFQVFLGMAFALVCIEMLVSDRRRLRT